MTVLDAQGHAIAKSQEEKAANDAAVAQHKAQVAAEGAASNAKLDADTDSARDSRAAKTAEELQAREEAERAAAIPATPDIAMNPL